MLHVLYSKCYTPSCSARLPRLRRAEGNTLPALAADNSLDCPLNASRTAEYAEHKCHCSKDKTELVALAPCYSLQKLVLAPGTPSRHPHPVPCSHYATSVLGASQLVPQNSRTMCRPGRSRDSADFGVAKGIRLVRFGYQQFTGLLA